MVREEKIANGLTVEHEAAVWVLFANGSQSELPVKLSLTQLDKKTWKIPALH